MVSNQTKTFNKTDQNYITFQKIISYWNKYRLIRIDSDGFDYEYNVFP